ncbi:hypothetical protein [Candidatus Hodarchaeum mangrovi]
MTDLKFIGRILGAVGGLIMIILGIVELIEAVDLLQFNLQLFDFNIISGAVQGNLVVIAIVTIICGTIAIYGYKALSNKGKGDQLVWGIIYIVLGLIGGTLGVLLLFISGVVLLIDYF